MKAITDFSAYKGKISNSGHDEHNRYRNGKAGDQSGTEWYIRSWYKRPWNVVIRFEDRNIANMIATLSIYAAKNNKIGYDQNQRTSYWSALKKAGYDPRKITVACEDDCSAGVMANVRAALELTGHSKWAKNINVNATTWTMRGNICSCGAKVKTFSDASHTNGTAYLLPGDILLKTSAHTAVNLGVGSKMKPSDVSGDLKPIKVDVKAAFVKGLQTALNASYGLSLAVDGSYGPKTKAAVDKHYLFYNKSKTIRNSHVSWLQDILCSVGYMVDVDGSYGPITERFVKEFQKKYKLTVDGYAGLQTHTKLIDLK